MQGLCEHRDQGFRVGWSSRTITMYRSYFLGSKPLEARFTYMFTFTYMQHHVHVLYRHVHVHATHGVAAHFYRNGSSSSKTHMSPVAACVSCS